MFKYFQLQLQLDENLELFKYRAIVFKTYVAFKQSYSKSNSETMLKWSYKSYVDTNTFHSLLSAFCGDFQLPQLMYFFLAQVFLILVLSTVQKHLS